MHVIAEHLEYVPERWSLGVFQSREHQSMKVATGYRIVRTYRKYSQLLISTIRYMIARDHCALRSSDSGRVSPDMVCFGF